MERGSGRPSTYIACFQFFLAPTDAAGLNPDPARAPDIITNSWGCPVGPPPNGEDCALNSFDATLNAVRAAGILTVVAAGNGTPSCGTIGDPPAISPAVFTVGSTTNSDAISGFSLFGPVTVDGSNRLKPDIVAPGSSVRSAIPGSTYGVKSGTSMATPNVAGVAALVLSANPALRGDPAAVERILRETAVPLTSPQSCGAFAGSAVPNVVFGHGRVDAYAAVLRALTLLRDGFEP
jgi:subtilisin family serine protease